ncbi:hypothetical protein V1511DRAFT_507226 [Dipodascopsis uninucleata]
MQKRHLRWRMSNVPHSTSTMLELPGSGEATLKRRTVNDNYSPRPQKRTDPVCNACRQRKSRCDRSRPQCGLCQMQGWKCQYREDVSSTQEQGSTVNLDVRALMERLQSLETNLLTGIERFSKSSNVVVNSEYTRSEDVLLDYSGLEMPRKHFGSMMKVINWPIVTKLMTSDVQETPLILFEGLGPFYQEEVTDMPANINVSKVPQLEQLILSKYITYFMVNVHCYFPILDSETVNRLFSITANSNTESGLAILLNIVITFGALAAKDKAADEAERAMIESKYWNSTTVLLALNTSTSIFSIQACALAAFYLGAKSKICECFRYLQIASTASQTYIKQNKKMSQSFCCTFWCLYCYENDILSEIDLFSPTGITKYEDLVPYPSSDIVSMPRHMYHPGTYDNAGGEDEVFLLQLITNSSMRKSINRINATIYCRDVTNNARADYLVWMFQYTHEFEQHHSALQERIPKYIYNTPPNVKWNVNRLKRRRSAFNYIINRNFVDYVLHNEEFMIEEHKRAEILSCCRQCLLGCRSFILEMANGDIVPITGVFSPGLATITMTTILIVARTNPYLRSILENDLDHIIETGIQVIENITENFSSSFGWHAMFLKRLNEKAQTTLKE